jgi:vacuolar-type H+-ATPase subunit H
MEKVWEELKKIEAQAEQIRVEAQDQSKKITKLAQQEADKLLLNSKTYAEEEAQQLFKNVTEKANRKYEKQLKASLEDTQKLARQAETCMEKAANRIVDAVLGDYVFVTNHKVC